MHLSNSSTKFTYKSSAFGCFAKYSYIFSSTPFGLFRYPYANFISCGHSLSSSNPICLAVNKYIQPKTIIYIHTYIFVCVCVCFCSWWEYFESNWYQDNGKIFRFLRRGRTPSVRGAERGGCGRHHPWRRGGGNAWCRRRLGRWRWQPRRALQQSCQSRLVEN